MSATLLGVLSSGMRTSKDGHRDYDINWLVESDNVDDGPATIANVSGLPVVGSSWSFGNDNDPWAFCWPSLRLKEVTGPDRGEWTGQWVARQMFTTRPLSRCQTTRIEDPLAEPPRLSGTFTRYSKEATHTRQGDLLMSSSKELIRGIMTDDSNAVVNVTQNLLSLPLAATTQLRNHVNATPMWGIDKRCVKLSDFTWDRHLWGTCSYYYTVTHGFDVNFDKYTIPVVDRGTRVLSDNGNPDNPEDYIPYRHPKTGDRMEVLLDGLGGLLTDVTAPVIEDAEIEYEADFFVLGIPATL